MEDDSSNIALLHVPQDRVVAICRWLVLLPACFIVFSLAACFAGLPLVMVAFCLGVLLPPQSQVFLLLFIVALSACLGAIPAALLAYLLAPDYKYRVYLWLPLLLIAPYIETARVLYAINLSIIPFLKYSVASVCMPVIILFSLFLILKKLVSPARVVAASLTIFKDVLTELDKQVLILQLGLLIVSSNYWQLMTYSEKTLDWFESASLVLAVIATIALPVSLFHYRKQLSQQGFDNSKLLNIISVVIHAPLFVVLMGWLGSVRR